MVHNNEHPNSYEVFPAKSYYKALKNTQEAASTLLTRNKQHKINEVLFFTI